MFISWSGTQSQSVAALVREYLATIVQPVKPFLSTHNIGSGEQWLKKLTEELDDTQFGIFCLTRENIEKPWLHYEAGAIAKAGGRVAGLLIGSLQKAEFNNPFSHFQNLYFDKESFKKLVLDINENARVEVAAVSRVFESMWPELQSKYEAILTAESQGSFTPLRSTDDINDEILLRLRSIEGRISDLRTWQDSFQDSLYLESISRASIAGRPSVLISNYVIQYSPDTYTFSELQLSSMKEYLTNSLQGTLGVHSNQLIDITVSSGDWVPQGALKLVVVTEAEALRHLRQRGLRTLLGRALSSYFEGLKLDGLTIALRSVIQE